MIPSVDTLVSLVRLLYAETDLPEPFGLLAEFIECRRTQQVAEPIIDQPNRRLAARAKKIAALLDAPDALQLAVGLAQGSALSEKLVTRAETMLGQLLLGNLAEQAFEHIYRTVIGTTELTLEDDRSARNDTDYRVLNGGRRQVFRINIKLHGARFRNASDMVNLEPEDCFPLATYKIHHGLQKQEQEVLPYLWVVIDCPIAATEVGKQIPRPWVGLIALAYASKEIKRKRKLEERVVEHLLDSTTEPFVQVVTRLRSEVAAACWYVLSARRANQILREKLFERVFAVRVKSFARNYAGAELNMHFSLRHDMTPLQRFLGIIKDKGLHGITAELERGTV
ncbi:MAG: hypothetical protein AB7O21_00680 [Gammaproteobacteria bacterium]